MRITHVTNTLRADGTGITNVVIDLAATQSKAGHDVRVLCRVTDAATSELLADHGVELVDGIDASSARSLATSWSPARRALRGAEIVHVHTVRATLLALLARPVLFARRSISTLHNPYQRTVPVMYLTTRIVSISQVDADHVRTRSRGLRRPVVIKNGLIGSPRLPPAASVAAATLPGRAIVYCGALYERKGVDVLLRAMVSVLKEVHDARLYLVGNRDNPEVEALAHELGLDDVVRFEGFHADPRPFMKAAAVFVLPSRAEGFGNVLTEARSVGAPIVASDASLAARLSARAQENLAAFTLDHAAARYVAEYRDMVDRRGSGRAALG